MRQGVNLKREARPTLSQLQYLSELDSLEKVRGVQGTVAVKCGVNPSTVNRYFKACVEDGILTSDFHFTEKGRLWYEYYKRLSSRLNGYLAGIGIPGSERSEAVRSLLENTDCHVLEAIISGHEREMPVLREKTVKLSDDFGMMLETCGRIELRFAVYRVDNKTESGRFSMAMRGFREDAYLVEKDNEAYIELILKDMTARSRLDGRVMTGILSRIKYLQDGSLAELPIEDGRVRIPVDAFAVYRGNDGSIKGKLAITVQSSVGPGHMPESTAMLVFWL